MQDKEKFKMPWLEVLWEEVNDFQQRVDLIILEISPHVDANEQELHVLCEQLKLDISAPLKLLLEKTDTSSKTLNSDSVKDIHSAFHSMSKLDPTNLKAHCKELEHFKSAVQPMVLTV